ncbi:hypothetical protein B9Z55_006551 [Caenorhabditis nigoni]|uniref:Major sperm protein n=1 Tax=Caenorhabditis nigoni TaxID=1611254 RepID=A0A2G5V603_9PELO|nr:hypothetical protein B9Z55_006551 [Caenorhabditis nigoni]
MKRIFKLKVTSDMERKNNAFSLISSRDLGERSGAEIRNRYKREVNPVESPSSTTLHQIAMAQSVPPGDIQTQPNAKIVFNAPYDDKHTYHIKVINSSARRIGYGIKTTNMKRLGVDPPCGVLDPKEAVLLAVSCDAFAYGQEDTNNDRITVEWTNTPDGAAKQFRREWFQGDGMVRRKNLPIEYNP